MNFQITGLNALLLVALCVPGFLLTKFKLLKEDHIKGFAVFLMYVCSPALSLYSFQQAQCNADMLKNIGILILIAIVMQFVLLGLAYLINIRDFKTNPAARVATVATVFGNVGFFGVPMLHALLPDHPEAVIYSALLSVLMNLVGWTVGMFMLSGDKSLVSIKRFLINPTTICLLISLPLYFTNTALPAGIMNWVEFFSKMSTPLAMTILGMRMAFVRPKELFTDYHQYLAIILKLVIFPLLVFGVLYALPVDPTLKLAIFILWAMPPAAVTLNYAELTDTAPKTAANIVILGSLFCVVTLPVLMLLA